MLDPKVVVALDFDKKNDALSFVDKISPSDCKLKVGNVYLLWARVCKNVNREGL